MEDDDPEDDLPLAQLRANLKASNVHLDDADLHLFLEADDEVTTSGSLTTDDIIDSITSDNTSPESDPDSDDDDPVPTAPPTFAKAMESISTIRHYLMTASKPLPRDDIHWKTINMLENLIETSHIKDLRQSTIKDL